MKNRLVYINVLGLLVVSLSPFLAFFSGFEVMGVNIFLFAGIILILFGDGLTPRNWVGIFYSVIILVTLMISFNLWSSDFFTTKESANLLLMWFSVVLLTGIWGADFSISHIGLTKILLITGLVSLCLAYSAFRLIFPEAAKTDFINANFAGLCSVLLMMSSYKYVVAGSNNNLTIALTLLLIAGAGAFFSSSRAALFVCSLLAVIFIFPRMLRPQEILGTAGRLFLLALIVGGSMIYWDVEFELYNFSVAQIDHITDRFSRGDGIKNESRLVQIGSFFSLFGRHPEFLLVPIPLEVYFSTATGKGFSDNSFLELAGYTGFLVAFLVFIYLEFKLFSQLSKIDAVILTFLLLSFNILLWLPFVALVRMYIISFSSTLVLPTLRRHGE